MKIAVVVPIVGGFGKKGFYHSQEIGLGKMLASMGHSVDVIKCVTKESFSTLEKEEHDGIRIIYQPVSHLGPHGNLPVDVIPKDADAVVVFSDTQLCIRKLYKYCMNNDICMIPYVGIAHSFQANLKSKMMDLLFMMTTLPVYKKIPVMCKTISAAEELVSLGVKQCYVAPVGIDFDALKQDYESQNLTIVREKYGYSSDDVIISFVGRLQPEKRPLDAIKIFEKVTRPNKKFLIIGDGLLKSEIEEYISSHKLGETIQLIPQVPYNDMWEIHAISNFFVSLRQEEIFGMAVMEAVYYKSCVVARKAPGPDTILHDMKGHVLCDDDNEVLEVLNTVIVDKTVLSRDKETLEDNFTWCACGTTIEYLCKI